MKSAVQGLIGEECLLKGLKSVTGAEAQVNTYVIRTETLSNKHYVHTTPVRPPSY